MGLGFFNVPEERAFLKAGKRIAFPWQELGPVMVRMLVDYQEEITISPKGFREWTVNVDVYSFHSTFSFSTSRRVLLSFPTPICTPLAEFFLPYDVRFPFHPPIDV